MKSSIQHLWVFASNAYAHVLNKKYTESNPMNDICILLNYGDNIKWDHLYDIEKGSIIKRCKVKFIEFDNIKQIEEFSKVSIETLLVTIGKIESFHFVRDLKNDSEDILGDLDYNKSKKYPVV